MPYSTPAERGAPDPYLISYAVKHDAMAELVDAGLTADHFEGEWRTQWLHLVRAFDAGTSVSRVNFRVRFPDFTLKRVDEHDVPELVTKIKTRRRNNELLGALTDAATTMRDPERVDDVLRTLQARMTGLDVPDGGGVALVATSTVTIEPVQWFIEPIIPLGTVVGLVGKGGVGKSSLASYWTARATTGRLGGDVREPCDVVIVSTEEHLARVTVPRLLAAGADLDRVHTLADEALVLPDDLAAFDRAIDAHDVRLVIFDPVVALLPGSVNTHRQQDVRRVVAELKRRAEERDLAFLCVMHVNKTQSTDAGDRTSGSHAWRDAFRSMLVVGKDPNNEERRILVHDKSNSGVIAQARRFRLAPVVVEKDGVLVPTCRVVFQRGSADGITAADLLAGPKDERKNPKHSAAVALLSEMLATGPAGSKVVKDAAVEQGISSRTLDRAKSDLGVKSERASSGNRGDGLWTWRLP